MQGFIIWIKIIRDWYFSNSKLIKNQQDWDNFIWNTWTNKDFLLDY